MEQRVPDQLLGEDVVTIKNGHVITRYEVLHDSPGGDGLIALWRLWRIESNGKFTPLRRYRSKSSASRALDRA